MRRGKKTALWAIVPLLLFICTRTTQAARQFDVLRILEMSVDMQGVSLEAGLCTQRKDTSQRDLAYRIDKKIQLSAPTKQLFSDAAFPEDFSLMTTVKARRKSHSFLLSLYDAQGIQQLGLEIGRSPSFFYADHKGQPTHELYPQFKKINLADGKWHRIAYSVEAKSVTLYLDCKKVETLELMRGDRPVISTDGVLVFGTRFIDEEVFEGEIQQLLLVDDPKAAAEYCKDYIPDCDSPLPYSTHMIDYKASPTHSPEDTIQSDEPVEQKKRSKKDRKGKKNKNKKGKKDKKDKKRSRKKKKEAESLEEGFLEVSSNQPESLARTIVEKTFQDPKIIEAPKTQVPSPALIVDPMDSVPDMPIHEPDAYHEHMRESSQPVADPAEQTVQPLAFSEHPKTEVEVALKILE